MSNPVSPLRKFLDRFSNKYQKLEDGSPGHAIPSEFGDLYFYPTDLFTGKTIEPNIVEGSYSSPEHYIQTHLGLLKEDFQRCLRNGIATYLENPRAKNPDIWVYSDVTVNVPNGGQRFYEIVFPKSISGLFQGTDWKESKLFVQGSMVILAKENFKIFYVAVVKNRGNIESNVMSPNDMHYITVEFTMASPRNDTNDRFLLVEPKTFFEPYHQVMRAMASFYRTGLPLKRYLVDVDTTSRSPDYIGIGTLYTIENSTVRLSLSTGWPSCETMGLNDSQRRVVFSALTHELVLIQGPPGTGKTHLAYKLISYLVANTQFTAPILVVCFKNRSLDRLLDGLLDRGIKLLRLGGGSKSEKLTQYNLAKVKTRSSNSIFGALSHAERLMNENAEELQLLWNSISLLKTKQTIVYLRILRNYNVISDSVFQFFGEEENIREARFNGWLLGSLTMQFDSNLLKTRQEEFDKLMIDEQSVRSLLATHNLNDLPLKDRWMIYRFWESQLLALYEIELKKTNDKGFWLKESHRELRDMIKYQQLVSTRPQVLGATTSCAAAHHRMLEKIAPAIVIVEEAGEVLESHVVASIPTSCQHLVLISDHQQLEPLTASCELAEKYNMSVSLFERMIRNGARCDTLTVQHRMRPEISALISPSIYPSLANNSSVYEYPNVSGVMKNVIFFHHTSKEEEAADSESRFNRLEAYLTLAFCSYLLKQDTFMENPGRITILTTYRQQEQFMKQQTKRFFLPRVVITTVDNYQGQENDVIILSLVRSNEEGNAGFLDGKNRVGLALSRAKHGLFIFGNIDCLVKKQSSIWNELKEVLESQGAIVTKIPRSAESTATLRLLKTPKKY